MDSSLRLHSLKAQSSATDTTAHQRKKERKRTCEIRISIISNTSFHIMFARTTQTIQSSALKIIHIRSKSKRNVKARTRPCYSLESLGSFCITLALMFVRCWHLVASVIYYAYVPVAFRFLLSIFPFVYCGLD